MYDAVTVLASPHSNKVQSEIGLLQEYYEMPRQQANQRMLTACDSLLRLYRPQEGWLANLRQTGLSLINSSTLAKKQIMKYAMGL